MIKLQYRYAGDKEWKDYIQESTDEEMVNEFGIDTVFIVEYRYVPFNTPQGEDKSDE